MTLHTALRTLSAATYTCLSALLLWALFLLHGLDFSSQRSAEWLNFRYSPSPPLCVVDESSMHVALMACGAMAGMEGADRERVKETCERFLRENAEPCATNRSLSLNVESTKELE